MTVRQPISNEAWDAGRMLARALRGRYPSAEYTSKHRPAEIIYWRTRCEAAGIDHEAIERAYEAERRARASRGRARR